MRYVKVAFLILFFGSGNTYSQLPNFEWAKRIGDNLFDIAQQSYVDADNNVYILGDFSGAVDLDPGPATNTIPAFGLTDVFVSKFNPNGDLIWVKRLGSGNYDTPIAIVVDIDGNVYISMEFDDDIDADPGPGYHVIPVADTEFGELILKLDSGGNFVWVNEYVYDYNVQYFALYSLTIDKNNNLLSTGFFEGTIDFNPQGSPYLLSNPSGYNKGFINKYDLSGNHIWTKTFGGTYNSIVYDASTDKQNNIYLTGYFDGTTDFDPGPSTYNLTAPMNTDDIFIVKLDSTGSFLWANRLGGNNFEEACDLEMDGLNNIYLAGYFTDTVDFDVGPSTDFAYSNGSRDAFVLKLDSAGNYLWSKKVGGAGVDIALNLAIDDSNNVIYAGTFTGAVDFDPQGLPFGMTGSSVDYSNLFISKLYSDGQFAWAFKFHTGYVYETNISLDNMNNIYCNGAFADTCDFDPDTSITNLMSAGGLDGFIFKLQQPYTIPIPVYHFNIYPNPNDGEFNLELPLDASYFLFDMLGRIVFEGNGLKGVNVADLSNLANGIYSIYVQYDSKFFSAGKVLIVN